MSVQITTAFVEQYRGNVEHLVQQKGSRLRDSVRLETVTGKNAFIEQLGTTVAAKRTSRHSDTPRLDVPHSRRRVSLVDYDWADLIDQEDKIRMLIDPTGPYTEQAAFALGRAMDDEIIEAADGTAFTGVDGSTSTSFTSGNIVDVQVGGSSSDVGLNVAKLRAAKEVLDSSDVDPEIERYCVVNAKQLKNLLGETAVTSSDFNTVKALVQGELDTFLGFSFIRTQRIGVDSNSDDKVLFYAKPGIALAVGQDVQVRISERADKNYSQQVFASMSIGATRLQEELVGYIECDPS
jgi:hypothetical protein